MINRNSNIFFLDQEVPIVSGIDLKDLKPKSKRVAVWQFENGDIYNLRGLPGFGLFAVKALPSYGEKNG